jgi:hypothetical protein
MISSTSPQGTELELFIQHQMEQEAKEVCPGHALEFQELLPSHEPNIFQELWVCIHCGHERVMTHHTGVRD